MSRNFSCALLVWLFCLTASAKADGCVIDTSGSLDFGQYDVFSVVATDSISMLIVTCDPLAAATITVEAGPSAVSGSISQRKMQHASSASHLEYNLFIDTAHTQIWGDSTVGNPFVMHNINDGNPRQLNVYGRLMPNQNPVVGQYHDTISVTVLP